jgi:hypothetical protein
MLSAKPVVYRHKETLAYLVQLILNNSYNHVYRCIIVSTILHTLAERDSGALSWRQCVYQAGRKKVYLHSALPFAGFHLFSKGHLNLIGAGAVHAWHCIDTL